MTCRQIWLFESFLKRTISFEKKKRRHGFEAIVKESGVYEGRAEKALSASVAGRAKRGRTVPGERASEVAGTRMNLLLASRVEYFASTAARLARPSSSAFTASLGEGHAPGRLVKGPIRTKAMGAAPSSMRSHSPNIPSSFPRVRLQSSQASLTTTKDAFALCLSIFLMRSCSGRKVWMERLGGRKVWRERFGGRGLESKMGMPMRTVL